jgi:hypothetical protein
MEQPVCGQDLPAVPQAAGLTSRAAPRRSSALNPAPL